MKKITILLAIISLLYACGNKSNHPRVADLDSLLYVLDTTNMLFKRIHPDSLQRKNKKYWDMLEIIRKEARDSITPEEMKLIGRFSHMKKPFRNYINRKEQLQEEIRYTQKQLSSLKGNIATGRITKDSIEHFFLIEKNAASSLIKDLHQVSRRAIKQMQEFDSLYPQMITLSKTLHERKIEQLDRECN